MKVLVVCAGSGGHLFPAIAFLEALKAQNSKTGALLVLPRRFQADYIEPHDFPVEYISICPFTAGFKAGNLLSFYRFLKGSWESLFIFIKFNPDIVAGFGGIESVPLVLLAWLCRRKTLIHEQNVLPGKANKLLSKFVDRVAVSFPRTKEYFGHSYRAVLTGNPLRAKLRRMEKGQALGLFGFSEDKFTLLVMGGSLGSRRINTAFLNTVSAIAEKTRLQVIHITGNTDYESVRARYAGMDIKVRLFNFLDSIEYAYNASDLVICRAGATTIAELVSFKLPAIIIPYPFAHKHQQSNADVLKGSGSAIIIPEENLDSGILKQEIEKLLGDKDALAKMRAGYSGLSSLDPGISLVSLVNQLCYS